MKYFGTDGIRGLANEVLTPEIVYKVGRFIGNSSDKKIKVIVGQDSRISCDMFEASLIAGITSAGGDVYKMGVVPTPAVSFLVKEMEADYGVMISASHNSVVDNGIKIVDSNGNKICNELEKEIEAFIDAEDSLYRATAGRIGRVLEKKDGIAKYVVSRVTSINSDLSNMKIVVDCANGAASYVSKQIFASFKCEVIFIHNEPSGLNINDNCGSTHLDSLSKAVVENRADLGMAFDGDADRILMVDSEGNKVDGDVIMYILASKYMQNDQLKNNKIAVTSMTNLGIISSLKNNLGVDVVTTDVGDKYVAMALEEHDLIVGGETSGHIILKEYANFGDGLLVGLQVLDYLYEKDLKLNLVSNNVKIYPSKLVNVNVIDKEYIMTNRQLLDEILRISNILGDEGRVLVRASGTENVVRVLVECLDEEECEEFLQSLVQTIKSLGEVKN